MLACLEEKRAGLKTGLYCFEAIAQRITDADRCSHRKREEHSQDWLCYELPGGWRAGILLDKKRGRDLAALSDDSSRLGLPARIADRWRFAPWQSAQTEHRSLCCCCGKSRGDARTPLCAKEFARDGKIAARRRGWTWCRAGLLRLTRGRRGFDSHLVRKIL
jgi:hypothetical protein